MIPTLLIVTMVLFTLVRLIPGDIIATMVEENRAQVNLDELKAKLGMDKPVHIQYLTWVGGMVRGDLGKSLWTDTPTIDELKRRLPVTLELGALALLFSLSMAIPIGVLSAIRQDTFSDYLARSLAIAALAVPGFWIATLVMVLPAIYFRWMPAFQFIPFDKDPMGNLQQFAIPAAIMALHSAGSTMRMTRGMMLEVLRQDYIRTAWSKGLAERLVIYRHALKNAVIPVITIVGVQLAYVIGGSAIMEAIF